MSRRHDRVVNTLLDLLSKPSAYGQDKYEIISYAMDWFSELGMSVTLHGQESLPAICATNGSGGLILSGHLDTVPIGSGWEREQPVLHIKMISPLSIIKLLLMQNAQGELIFFAE